MDFITLMLIDKGYYDYDYEQPDEKWLVKKNAAKNNEQLKSVLERFGIQAKKPDVVTPDEMQRAAMEEIQRRKNKQ